MTKKITSFIASIVLPTMMFAQTIVSTTPENKKVILEEFTGIHCVYCPQGHAIAKQIMDSNPGNAFAINVHAGSYAVPSAGQPDFRTAFGTMLVNQSGLVGYPAGTVNRHVFPGSEMGNSGTTAMSREKWTQAANTVMSQPSYVNVAATAEVSTTERQLIVKVEAYYTGNSPVATNYLNVALIQNNTKGPQTGGNQGDNYVHMHRLVSFLTGQWGEEITTTTNGSLFSKTYTFDIPLYFNNVFADITEMEIVAFVTESHQEIISGNGAEVNVLPSAYSNEAAILQVNDILPQCSNVVNGNISLMNGGNNTISSLNINYSVNGGPNQTYTWTGTLEPNDLQIVTVPFQISEILDNNTVNISLQDDENPANNAGTVSFTKAAVSKRNVKLKIQTDAYGEELSWSIKNSAGTTIESGSNYADNQTYNFDIALPEEDCYTFELKDSYGDGGKPVSLTDIDGVVIYSTTGNYNSGAVVNFNALGLLGTSDADLVSNQIYPNPSNGLVTISLKKSSNVDIYDLSGKHIYQTRLSEGKNELNLTGKPKGVYVVKISDGKSVMEQKLIIK